MDYNTFLIKVLNNGIENSIKKYNDITDKLRLDGAISALKACEKRTPIQLKSLLESSRQNTRKAFKLRDNYWYYRSYELHVEWVCRHIAVAFPSSGLGRVVSSTEDAIVNVQSILT